MLTGHPNPITGYDEAIRFILERQAMDAGKLNPVCRTCLLTHGEKVAEALVLLHGFTNCPQQFATLARIWFEKGYNVLTIRISHHGLADRLTRDLEQMTAQQVVSSTEEMIDAAHGLGREVKVLGISLGGSLALWVAQYYPVAGAIAIAPLVSLRHWSISATRLLSRLLIHLPSFFLWWDPRVGNNIRNPRHAYPRFSSRALGQVFRIGLAVDEASRRAIPPQAHRILLVTNGADPAVENVSSLIVLRRWQAHSSGTVEHYEFEASHHLLHDMIDEQQPGQRTDLVYPVLVNLVDQL